MPSNASPTQLNLSRDFIEKEIANGASLTDIAAALTYRGIPTTRHSIRRALRRWNSTVPTLPGQEAARTSIKGDQAEIVSHPSASIDLGDLDTLLRERGLDPEQWEVVNLVVNEWEALTSTEPTGQNEIVTLRQLKAHLQRKRPFEFVLPAKDVPSYRRPRTARIAIAPDPNESKLVVFTGDQQAPYHNKVLHELFCQWLEENKPHEGVLIGDTVDFPDISRHPDNPEWHVSAQECIDSGYAILRDYVQSSETTDWRKLCGNHDERIRNRLLSLGTKLYGLRPADTGEGDERPVWHIANLLHLDDLGIKYIDPNGKYDQAQAKITPYLAARHGWIARKGSGASALATLTHLGYSVVVGHTHRQALVHHTTHDIDGTPTTLAAVETGCMCRVEDGLGYAVAPDWQNGFATAEVWPDGTFKLDLATFVSEKLLWRDQRYGE